MTLAEVNLLFVDVEKAHFNDRCDEEGWAELPDESVEHGRFSKLRRWLYGS